MAQKLKHKILVVAHKVCYMSKIIHVDFRCGTGCYTMEDEFGLFRYSEFVKSICYQQSVTEELVEQGDTRSIGIYTSGVGVVRLLMASSDTGAC
ncbi:hypothetical protein RHMOL_Rhmol05G0209000 [Rhododendron molle]|uniref:Uncharacterized protein n=1 Tax=Rhododendron molle TaxID=49168 RepID=A0ACC0NT09_RHOML|nr:hypothetical protein RHMOL_Rhmol05G0209000 [Rhododendron molle]